MSVQTDAEELARDAGMQFDSRYMDWIAPNGKFESEQWYAPYFWDMVLRGDAEDICGESEDCLPGALVRIDAEESEAFALECGHWILAREDSQGFVYVTVHATREAAERKYFDWIGEPQS